MHAFHSVYSSPDCDAWVLLISGLRTELWQAGISTLANALDHSLRGVKAYFVKHYKSKWMKRNAMVIRIASDKERIIWSLRPFIEESLPLLFYCNFYRTLLSLGSGLWVPVSVTTSKTFLKLCWCDSGGWWYLLNTGWWCQQGNLELMVVI